MDKRLMRVTGTHPETYTVDIEDWRTGWKMKGVPVMVGPATGRTGTADLPVFTETAPGFAVVDFLDGVTPIVLGFIHNRLSQMRFTDGRAVFRHDSDVYLTVGRGGETELYHPSGAMIRIGEAAAHEDLAAQDFDRLWSLARNTGKDVKIALEVGPAKVTLSGTALVMQFGATTMTLSAAGVVIDTPALDVNQI